MARVGRGEAWLARVEAATLAALAARGEATARELTADVPELGAKLTVGEGKTWAGTMGVSTRVLFLLATEGLIVRTRPLGTWTSGQYRWATTEHWLGAPLAEIDHARACSELLAALAAFVRTGHDDGHPVVDRAGPPRRRRRRSSPSRPRRSGWATTPATCSPTISTPSATSTRGWRCSPGSTPPRWGGRTEGGTSATTRPSCSTATATRARRCGRTAGPWAPGVRPRRATWRSSSSPASTPRAGDAWTPSASGSRPGSATSGSGLASRRRSARSSLARSGAPRTGSR